MVATLALLKDALSHVGVDAFLSVSNGLTTPRSDLRRDTGVVLPNRYSMYFSKYGVRSAPAILSCAASDDDEFVTSSGYDKSNLWCLYQEHLSNESDLLYTEAELLFLIKGVYQTFEGT